MKNLISINTKFMELTPKELIKLICDSKKTEGIEVYIDYDSEYEREYLEDIVYESKKNNLFLQIHGNAEMDLERQIQYFKTIEKYSDDLGYPIVVTLHTVYDEDKEISLKKSMEYIKDLIKSIDTKKVVISLENLNNEKDIIRLGTEEITPLILNNDNLYFTYDIGHEIASYGKVTNLDKQIIEKIRNVHIHTNDGQGNDHQPIYENDTYREQIIKAIMFLKDKNYQYNIVYEYDLYVCHGETIKEKVIDYLCSIDNISEDITNS